MNLLDGGHPSNHFHVVVNLHERFGQLGRRFCHLLLVVEDLKS